MAEMKRSKVRYYFKVNYNLDAINNDPTLRTFSNKIIPIDTEFHILRNTR